MTKVYRLIPENNAIMVFCPTANTQCKGASCSAWFWINEPHLETFAKIDIARAQDSGLLERNGMTGPLPNVLDDLEAFNAMYEKFAQITVTVADFSKPTEPGWEVDGEPCYDSDEGLWLLKFTRTTDKTATGFCGMVGPQIINDGE